MTDLSPKISWLDALHPRYLFDLSTLILIVANLIPLLGILFWHWDLFTLMMLYWSETGIIGFWHILRMAIEAKWFSLFLVPFFTVHFGGFMTGHFFFLMTFFGKAWSQKIHGISDFFGQVIFGTDLWIPFMALFVSHGVSFFLNYPNLWSSSTPPKIKGAEALPEWAQKLAGTTGNIGQLMAAPYNRIIVMHLTILFGGFLSMILQMPSLAFILLIALKIIVDTASHARKNFNPVVTS